MASAKRPTLWHIAVSHFSEKARWALEHKSVTHARRTPPPGFHIPLAFALSGGRSITLPILELEGQRLADSSDIIAALERRFPTPALYPDDPHERRRALELEDWFDEELAPYTRRLAFYELRREPELAGEIMARAAPDLAARAGPTLVPLTRLFVGQRYRARDAAGAEYARAKILAALDRLEDELGDSRYLVGDRFTVADLAAAALLYPLVLPPEGPPFIERMPEAYERFRAPLRERPAYRWVQDIFARHRKPGRVSSSHDPRRGDRRGGAQATLAS
jgi:glutathione S-transferase